MKKITFALLGLFLATAASAQFAENFESSTDIPDGWTVINQGDVNGWEVTDVNDLFGVPAHSGNNAATIFYDEDEDHDDYLITPAITVTAGVTDYFSFWARSIDEDYPEVIDVRLSTTGTDAADFTVTLEAGVAPESGLDYFKYGYDLSAYAGQTVYIAFYSSTLNQDVFEVDDVRSTHIPTCIEPSALTADDVTATGATLNYTTDAATAQIEYGPAGFTEGSGTIIAGSSTSATLSGLTGATAYTAYVSSNCGAANGLSESISISFTTASENDTCETALAVTASDTFENGAATYSTVGATTDFENIPSCQENYTNDVWFTVTVPASGSITLQTGEVAGSGVDDTILTVYSGSCGAFTEEGCSDDTVVGEDFFSKVTLTGRTPGEVLYVMISQYDSLFGTDPGEFSFSAFDASLLSAGGFDKNTFTAWPNPVKDRLNLSYTENMTDVAVYNMLGQKVMGATPSAQDASLDLSSLSNGAYTVKVATANAVKTIKVLKQ